MIMKKLLFLLPILFSVFIVTPAFADSGHSWTTTVESKTTVRYCDETYSTQTLGFDGSWTPTYVYVELPDDINTAQSFKIDFTNSVETGHNQNCWSDSYSQSVSEFLQNTSGGYVDYKKSFYVPINTINNQVRFYIRTPVVHNIKLTFTDSLDPVPCPEPEPCPDCGDASRFIQIVIDAFWKYHIAFAGVIVSVIAITLVFKFIRKIFK